MIVVITTNPAKKFKRYGVKQAAIAEAVLKAEKGLMIVNLGDNVLKLSIARDNNRGPRHGCRGIFIMHSLDIFLFIDIFAKSEKDNLTPGELSVFRDLALTIIDMRSAALMHLAEASNWSIDIYDR